MKKETKRHPMLILRDLVMRARKNLQKRDEEALEKKKSEFEYLNEGFSSDGLEKIEELIKLVSRYIKLGVLNSQDIISRIRKDFPNEPLNTKMVDDALAIINAEKNIKQAIKNKKPKLDALNDAFNDYQANGGTLSLTVFIKGLTSHTREQKKIKEQAKVEERKTETETISESKPKTKEDKITNKTTDINLKNEVLIDPASSQILEKKIKVIKENALHRLVNLFEAELEYREIVTKKEIIKEHPKINDEVLIEAMRVALIRKECVMLAKANIMLGYDNKYVLNKIYEYLEKNKINLKNDLFIETSLSTLLKENEKRKPKEIENMKNIYQKIIAILYLIVVAGLSFYSPLYKYKGRIVPISDGIGGYNHNNSDLEFGSLWSNQVDWFKFGYIFFFINLLFILLFYFFRNKPNPDVNSPIFKRKLKRELKVFAIGIIAFVTFLGFIEVFNSYQEHRKTKIATEINKKELLMVQYENHDITRHKKFEEIHKLKSERQNLFFFVRDGYIRSIMMFLIIEILILYVLRFTLYGVKSLNTYLKDE